jgi:hypothetical protein
MLNLKMTYDALYANIIAIKIIKFNTILIYIINCIFKTIIYERFWLNQGNFCTKFFIWQFYKLFNFYTIIAYKPDSFVNYYLYYRVTICHYQLFLFT